MAKKAVLGVPAWRHAHARISAGCQLHPGWWDPQKATEVAEHAWYQLHGGCAGVQGLLAVQHARLMAQLCGGLQLLGL